MYLHLIAHLAKVPLAQQHFLEDEVVKAFRREHMRRNLPKRQTTIGGITIDDTHTSSEACAFHESSWYRVYIWSQRVNLRAHNRRAALKVIATWYTGREDVVVIQSACNRQLLCARRGVPLILLVVQQLVHSDFPRPIEIAERTPPTKELESNANVTFVLGDLRLDQVMELRLRSKYTFLVVHVAIVECSMRGLHWLGRRRWASRLRGRWSLHFARRWSLHLH